MTYELCLEYGTYPLRPVDAWADEINTAPAFITEDKKLLELPSTILVMTSQKKEQKSHKFIM